MNIRLIQIIEDLFLERGDNHFFFYNEKTYFHLRKYGPNKLVNLEGEIIELPPGISHLTGSSEYMGKMLLSDSETHVCYFGETRVLEGVRSNVSVLHRGNYLYTKNFDPNFSGVYDLKNEKRLYTGELCDYKYMNETAVWISKNFGDTMVKKNIQTGEDIYTFEIYKYLIETFGEPVKSGVIFNIIGEYNGILWVSCVGGRLLGLNPDDATVIHTLGDMPDVVESGHPYYGRIPYPHYMEIIESKGKMAGMVGEYYWELDLNTLNLSGVNLAKQFNLYYMFGCSYSCFDDDYKILWGYDLMACKIFGFDIDTQEFWGPYDAPPGHFLGIIKVHKDKLYIGTGFGCLMEFQIEK